MSATAAPFRLPDAPAETDLVAKYFRGLGDPIRLRILELLRTEGELRVGELVRRLALPQPQISNHLACLRWCGFVEARRNGRTRLQPNRRRAGGDDARARRLPACRQRRTRRGLLQDRQVTSKSPANLGLG